MKYFLIIFPVFLYSEFYQALVEPFDTYTITSKVSGQVVYTNKDSQFKKVNNEIIVKIDDEVSKINYEVAKTTYEIKKEIYEKISSMTTKSKSEKDKEKIAFLQSKQEYINAKEDFLNRTIKVDNNLYISEIKVKEGSYVTNGTPLFDAFDINKSRITIFVSFEDIENIDKKEIIVDGASDNYKLYNYSKVADLVYISSYKVELVGKAPKLFSKIAKVEIK